ncbi:stage II sporulation protein M [Paenibacillus sp. MSJ-34]|uniref:stage II sporulation protein M n=1 Tax=Paenibacillus sp. MSJ-34 TaxID=2841529 RepID=UPI001C0F685F|nr:stage II sporulation protein M [Paenibacillus sp. MSJ-34]MBU5444629.1 stage II sporulation protein M [Paenibacillus sp. MSJ-34]
MDIQRFIREHKRLWSELDGLLSRFERRKRSVQAAQIDRLTQLYKTASAHLAYAQTYYPNDEIGLYLNQLVSRAHHALHAEQWKTSNRLGDFFKRRFTGYILERRWFVLLALLLFGVGALSGFIAVWQDPSHLHAVIPAEIADRIDPHRVGEGHEDLQSAIVSSSIMTNNIRVAILAFASGITFGALTVYVLVYNGLLLGALAAVFWQSGQSYVFWAYILPHGIIELTAIFIAGGAGLYMGYRMINPGPYTRKYMFLRSVKESALLLVGTIPLFVIAGIIEGYITPSALSLEAKYGVAAATLVALALYIFYGKLNEKRTPQAESGAAGL